MGGLSSVGRSSQVAVERGPLGDVTRVVVRISVSHLIDTVLRVSKGHGGGRGFLIGGAVRANWPICCIMGLSLEHNLRRCLEWLVMIGYGLERHASFGRMQLSSLWL